MRALHAARPVTLRRQRPGTAMGTRPAEVATVCALAVVAGAMPALGVSPLLMVLALAAVIAGLQLLDRPGAAVNAAVAVVLLPPDLLPTQAQSALELGAVALAGVALLLAAPRQVASTPVPLAVLLLGTLVAWSGVALLWSPSLDRSTDLLRRYVLVLLLVLVVVLGVRSREALDRLAGVLTAVGWLVVACGAVAALSGQETPDGRLAVLGLNPNQLGNMLLLVSVAVLWRAVAPGFATRARGIQAAGFLLSALVLILLSGSRGSLLAYVLLVLGLTAFRGVRRWAVTTAALALLLLLMAPAAFGTVANRLVTEDPEELSRTTLWQAGLALVADHPFGVGLGEGPYVLPRYVDARTSLNHFEARDHVPAHNPVIEIADDAGLVGAGLFLSVLLTAGAGLVSTAVRARRAGDGFWWNYAVVVGVGGLAFGVGAMKSGGMGYDFATYVLLSLWLLAGRDDLPSARAGTP